MTERLVLLVLFACLPGCRTTPVAGGLEGLACDAGRCAPGHACDPATTRCVPAGVCDRVTADGACQRCGDGVATGSEACDGGGETAACNADCTPSRCGDGKPNAAAGEQCDLGTANDGSYGGCTSACHLGPRCGDGAVDAGEVCDAGGASRDGWGLTRQCRGDCSAWAPWCGDGTVDPEEACDSGASNGDGWSLAGHCRADCSAEAPHCGDGLLDAGPEGCDPGAVGVEGCGADCQPLPGYGCVVDPGVEEPGPLTPGDRCYLCGNGRLEPGEDCDGGAVGLVGCEACRALPHWHCARLEPPVASPGPEMPEDACWLCGDGVLDPGELCDDGDTSDCTPPCSADCRTFANVCGDGVARCGEACDGSAAGLDCRALGFATAGAPTCGAGCLLERSSCACGLADADVDGDGLCDPADPTPAGESPCATPVAPGALVLAASPAALSAGDLALLAALSAWGYRTSVLACPLAASAPAEAAAFLHAAATSRVVLVAPSCGAGAVSAPLLAWAWQGVLLLGPASWSAAGVAASTLAATGDASGVGEHFVVAHAAGPLSTLAAGAVSDAGVGLAPGAVELLRVDGRPVAFAVAAGATLAGSVPTAGRRVAFGLGGGDVRALSVTGRALLARAVLWASGRETSAGCLYCGGPLDADGDGYGEGCDCDDQVAECNAGWDGGTASTPARDCVRNWDAQGGHAYEFKGSAYVVPDCYEVACGTDWNKGGLVEPGPNRGADCFWADGSAGRTLADAVAAAASSSESDHILTTGADVTLASDLVLPTAAGPVQLTSLVPVDLAGHDLVVDAAESELRVRELRHVGQVTLGGAGVMLAGGMVSVAGNLVLAGTGASLHDTIVDGSGVVLLAGSGASLARVALVSSAPVAIEVTGAGCTLSELTVSGCSVAGVRLRADAGRLEHTLVDCGGDAGPGSASVVVTDGSLGNVIAGNLLVGHPRAGVELGASASRTTIDATTVAGWPGGPRPLYGVWALAPELDLCLRDDLFADLGDGVASGVAVRLDGALTTDTWFDAHCTATLPGVLWQNAVFDAAGACEGPGCATLPCKEAAGSLCADPQVREQRFFPLAHVPGVGADFSTDPGFADPPAARWCVSSALLVDRGLELGYARVPPYLAPGAAGAGPDIGGLEAGVGVCGGTP